MAGSNQITIGPVGATHNYTIAAETLVPKGKRNYLRRNRVAGEGDPMIPKIARWQYHGPIGRSREGPNGELGHDHSTLETRYDGLLTSLGAVSTTTVSSLDSPLSGSSAMLGGFMLGARMLGGGTSLATPTVITHIKEMTGHLFLGRGAFVTQLSGSSFAVEATHAVSAVVRGMELWFNKLRIALGGSLALLTVTSPTSSGATYTAQQVSGSDVLAKEMTVGNDRLWLVKADAAGTNENKLMFTADDFASISSGFAVGDRGIGATGIGTMGGVGLAGSETGLWGYTDDGIAFNLISALADAKSTDNGRKQAQQFGWHYVTTSLGLYAVKGLTANPIGIGTDSMSGFEGWDGVPVAVLAWRESLFVAYEDSAGTTWRILRGVFDPNLTEGTGELQWYPFATRTNAQIQCLGATPTPTLPTICWGEGANTLARISQGRAGRDISDTTYPYSVAGGQWFGSAMMRNQGLRKTIRWGRFTTENCTASNTWTLAISFDGGSYTNIGSAVTSNGAQKVVSATMTSAPTGNVPKPRLTQVAASSSAPPQLRGTLEIGYDERPDKVTEIAVVFAPISKAELTRLRALDDGEDSTGRQPVEIRLPEDATVRYGYVTNIEETDLTDARIIGAACTLILVETS